MRGLGRFLTNTMSGLRIGSDQSKVDVLELYLVCWIDVEKTTLIYAIIIALKNNKYRRDIVLGNIVSAKKTYEKEQTHIRKILISCDLS